MPAPGLSFYILFFITSSALFAPIVSRADLIEEIIVTADLRDTGIHNLATSATVLQPDDAGTTVQHLEEILARAPNVNLASGASRSRFVQIRGVGERGQFSEPLNSSVGLIVDGVDLSGVGAAATLFDVQQVEVLRGPQGTLYGANALAGLINVVTGDPTQKRAGQLRLDAGDHGALGIGAVVSGPLSETVGYRLSGQQYRDDGFMENDFLRRDNTANRDESTIRGKLTWQGESASVKLLAGYVNVDNGYDAFSLDNDRHTQTDQPGHDQQETFYGAAHVSADVSDAVEFAGSLSVARTDVDYGYDEDWAFEGFHPFGYTSTDRYLRDRTTTTVDARWLSKPGEDIDGWAWVVGAYGLRQSVELTRQYTFLAGPFDSDYDVDRVAVYGEVSKSLNDLWQLSVGARFERHQSDYEDNFGVAYDPKDDLFGGRVLLERELTGGDLFYVGLTQGYKAGGFNLDGSLAADLREYDPETLWNLEVGYKVRMLDDRLNVSTALFRMQREDIQISTSTERNVGNNGAVEFVVYTGNAAEGFNQGVEFEAQFAATDNLSLFVNFGLLDSEYEDYVDNSGRDLDGREQAHAPTYQFFVGAKYQISERWSIGLEAEGRDAYFFAASHSAKSDSYELINANLTYQRDNWQVRLWGRNLADEDYFVRGFFFGNDPRDLYTARPFTQLGEPRQIGVTLRLRS